MLSRLDLVAWVLAVAAGAVLLLSGRAPRLGSSLGWVYRFVDIHPDQHRPDGGSYLPSPSQYMLAFGLVRERHHDPLGPNPDAGRVIGDRIGDRVKQVVLAQPAQRQRMQRGKPVGREETAQRDIRCCAGSQHIRACDPFAQQLWGDLDELDPISRRNHRIRHRFPLGDASQRLHRIVEAVQVLHIQRTDHIDTGIQELFDVLPTLLVPAPGNTRVSQLVDHHRRWSAVQHRAHVELTEG